VLIVEVVRPDVVEAIVEVVFVVIAVVAHI
jgi:hypothetical protein